MNRVTRGLASWVLALGVTVPAAAQERGGELLDAASYRTDLEEIIVYGQAPAWRGRSAAGTLRPEDIEFFGLEPEERLQWLPPYSREERDAARGVRDRKNETPELKLFEIRF